MAYLILPIFGLHFNVGSSGHSMDPTILDGAMTIWSDRVPFSELKIGDIIIYRTWADMTEKQYAKASATVKIFKEGEVPPAEEPKPTYRDENIEYTSDGYVMHRIVEIRQDDEYLDRALFTRGDSSITDAFDPRPTFESGYVGVVTWTKNYIGWPFRIMYSYNGFLWLVCIVAVLGVALLVWHPKAEDKSKVAKGKNSEN